MTYTVLIPAPTHTRADDYLATLRTGVSAPGARLKSLLPDAGIDEVSGDQLLDALLGTKVPQIFAESAVGGDGSDWNLTELGLLGDLSFAVPVTVFDNGHHTQPVPHAEPFSGTLVFTPGALLCNGRGAPPADWAEVTTPDGELSPSGYYGLYERRLLPVFQHVNAVATAQGKPALVTIPGLGCGQFAGPFRGQLGAALQNVLERFLGEHGGSFPNIRAVYFDPYSERKNARFEIHGTSFLVRPLLQGNEGKSQLCHPTAYEEPGDDFRECSLFSIVAWDHVSWPGNDFFAGSRCTDDGVKAAATDSMLALTGVEGHYDPQRGAYLPPPPFRTWADVVGKNGLML